MVTTLGPILLFADKPLMMSTAAIGLQQQLDAQVLLATVQCPKMSKNANMGRGLCEKIVGLDFD